MATASQLMALAEKSCLKQGFDIFEIGDTVDVHLKIVEGEKERIQIFTGVVISAKGSTSNRSFTVQRRVGSDVVERVFPLHCPAIDRLEVKKRGKVRRAKLYYLRDRIGKATRVVEQQGAELASSGPGSASVKPRQAGTGGEKKGSPNKAPAKK